MLKEVVKNKQERVLNTTLFAFISFINCFLLFVVMCFVCSCVTAIIGCFVSFPCLLESEEKGENIENPMQAPHLSESDTSV